MSMRFEVIATAKTTENGQTKFDFSRVVVSKVSASTYAVFGEGNSANAGGTTFAVLITEEAGGDGLPSLSESGVTLANGVNRSSGIFDATATLTILEEGTSVGLKMLSKSATVINVGTTAVIAGNEYYSGTASTHTFTDVAATTISVSVATIALTVGAPITATAFVTGGAAYGIGSIFWNESIDNASNNWGRNYFYKK